MSTYLQYLPEGIVIRRKGDGETDEVVGVVDPLAVAGLIVARRKEEPAEACQPTPEQLAIKEGDEIDVERSSGLRRMRALGPPMPLGFAPYPGAVRTERWITVSPGVRRFFVLLSDVTPLPKPESPPVSTQEAL